MSAERRLAAIMFTDMVGYSALTHADEERSLELLSQHRELLQPLFDEHDGHVIKSTGDGYHVEFPSAVQAVHCAVAIQTQLREHNATAPPDRQAEIRIGIHLGDVIGQAGDVYGDGVNIAARLEPLAEPGGICVSQQVYDQVAARIETPLINLGERELKNIDHPVPVYKVLLPWEQDAADSTGPMGPFSRLGKVKTRLLGVGLLLAIALGGFGWWALQGFTFLPTAQAPTSEEMGEPSVAVLPFENMSPEEGTEYFSAGMTEEIINALAQFEEMKVISSTSAFNVDADAMTLPEIGGELGVNYVMEGSVRMAEGDVRITAQLIRASTDEHLWSQGYDRRLNDVFAIQKEIASEVADKLEVTLAPEDEQQLAQAPTGSTEAYKLYLQGRFHWNKRTEKGLRTGLEYFQQAVEVDPNFAKAYAGIADSYSLLAHYDYMRPQEAYPQARAAARQALEIDDQLAEAHTSLARVFTSPGYDSDYQEAERHYKRAIELDPNYATAHHWYGWLLHQVFRRVEEGRAHIDRAVELDPLSPVIQDDVGNFYTNFGERTSKKAIRHHKKALEIDPSFQEARRSLARLKYLKGKLQEAEQLHKTMIENHPKDRVVYMDYGDFLRRLGRFDEAMEQYQRALELNPEMVAIRYLARSKELMGNWDRAGTLRQRAIELEPDHIGPYIEYARHLLARGQTDAALVQIQRMLEIQADSMLTPYWAGILMRRSGRFDAAIDHLNDHLNQAREMGAARDGVGSFQLAQVHMSQGDWDQARETLAQAEENAQGEVRLQKRINAAQGIVYAHTGQPEQAQGELDQLLQLSEYQSRRDYWIARVYLALGELEQGFEWLNRAYEHRGRNGPIRWITAEPIFSDEVQADPRFREVVRKLGLEP